MKKTLLIIAMTAMCATAAAQDTLLLTGPKENYHYDDWQWQISTGDTISKSLHTKGAAYYHFADDSLIIYGIAAALVASPYGASQSLEKVCGVLRIFKRTPSNTVYRLGEDLLVRLVDPPTYYMKMDAFLTVSYLNYQQYPVYPVYERYYDTPVAITDSFYVGHDQQDRFSTDNYQIRSACLLEFRKTHQSGMLNIPFMFYSGGYWEGSTYVNGGWQGDTNGAHFSWPRTHNAYPYIFPILTPKPDTTVISSDTTAIGDTLIVCDTTIIGGDTIVTYDTILSIGQSDMLQRFTGVMPNPAVGVAKVVSSFGMQRVEVYDATGAKVYDSRTAGLAHTIDVGRWPAGTYLVRIHTPQGVAVKKLVVRR